MPRNAEVIRQWTLLKTLDVSHFGHTLDELAEVGGVCTRTIRRDLDALQDVGFPLVDDVVEGKRRWKLDRRPFRALSETGFTLAEACALYFSRTLLEGLAGGPFGSDLQTAFHKLESALKPSMRQFLDRVPAVMAAKPAPHSRRAAREENRIVSALLDAILDLRRLRVRYHSLSSDRTKDYVLEPHKVVYGHGALYLLAHVPEYGQVRTFALERVKQVTPLDEHFERPAQAPLAEDVFANSLGVHNGPAEDVELEFAGAAARYVREREWHPSQQVAELPGGALRLHLRVSIDYALQAWVLGFGRLARVVRPATFAQQIAQEVEAARAQYGTLELELPHAHLERQSQRILPFPDLRRHPESPSRPPSTAATG